MRSGRLYNISATLAEKGIQYMKLPTQRDGLRRVLRIFAETVKRVFASQPAEKNNMTGQYDSVVKRVQDAINSGYIVIPGVSALVTDLGGTVRQYYIRNNGNDTNDGLSPTTALATFEELFSRIPLFFTNGRFIIDIDGFDGINFPQNVICPSYVGPNNLIPTGSGTVPPAKEDVYPTILFRGGWNIIDVPFAAGPPPVNNTTDYTQTFTFPGQAWGINTLRGTFLIPLIANDPTAFDSTFAIPILSNTADTVTVSLKAGFGSPFFMIAEPSAWLLASTDTARFEFNGVGCSVGFYACRFVKNKSNPGPNSGELEFKGNDVVSFDGCKFANDDGVVERAAELSSSYSINILNSVIDNVILRISSSLRIVNTVATQAGNPPIIFPPPTSLTTLGVSLPELIADGYITVGVPFTGGENLSNSNFTSCSFDSFPAFDWKVVNFNGALRTGGMAAQHGARVIVGGYIQSALVRYGSYFEYNSVPVGHDLNVDVDTVITNTSTLPGGGALSNLSNVANGSYCFIWKQ